MLLLNNAWFGGWWDVKFMVGSVPEFAATAIFVIGGFITRNMYVPKHHDLSKA